MARKKVDIAVKGVTVESVAAEGQALSHIDGQVVFMDFAVPGDVVDLRIYKRKKNYLEARIERIVTPSPDRLPALCPHFGVCGGCRWQPLPYPKQLEAKRQQVVDQQHDIVGTDGVGMNLQHIGTVLQRIILHEHFAR